MEEGWYLVQLIYTNAFLIARLYFFIFTSARVVDWYNGYKRCPHQHYPGLNDIFYSFLGNISLIHP